MNGNYYAIDIWGLIAALVMVAIAAGISETMRMGVGRTLLWSACRALLQLCAMGFIMEYVIRSNNPCCLWRSCSSRPCRSLFRVRKVCRRAWLDRCS